MRAADQDLDGRARKAHGRACAPRPSETCTLPGSSVISGSRTVPLPISKPWPIDLGSSVRTGWKTMERFSPSSRTSRSTQRCTWPSTAGRTPTHTGCRPPARVAVRLAQPERAPPDGVEVRAEARRAAGQESLDHDGLADEDIVAQELLGAHVALKPTSTPHIFELSIVGEMGTASTLHAWPGSIRSTA